MAQRPLAGMAKWHCAGLALAFLVACAPTRVKQDEPEPTSAVMATHSYLAAAASTRAQAQPAQAARDDFPAPSSAPVPAGRWMRPSMAPDDVARRAAADATFKRAKLMDADYMGNVAQLRGYLERQEYPTLEVQLDAILAKSLADRHYEFVEQNAANFAEEDAGLAYAGVMLIDAWVMARPDSAWAHYSRGLRWSRDARKVRGRGEGSDLTDAQAATMHADEVHARSELQIALKLNPKLAMAWVTLMDVDKIDGTLDRVTQDYQAAAQARPGSFLIPEAYEEALEPRWLGDYTKMNGFALDEVAKLAVNPRFWLFQGFSAADAACTDCIDDDGTASLAAYSTALEFGDRPSWLKAAGDAAVRLHRYALAHAFYARAQWYSPEDFDLVIDSDIMVALCNPSTSQNKLEVLEQEGPKYSGVPVRDYPREIGDCNYYTGELPWGSEPLPDPGYLPGYNIQAELLKAAAEAKKKH